MPDRRDVASWLPGSGPRKPSRGAPGPGASGPSPDSDENYPGKGLGRPLDGPGSIPGIGRRFLSITIDWIVCLLIARAFFGAAAAEPPGALWVNVIFAIENALLVGTAGFTLGQRIMGVRVETVDGGHPGLGGAVIRSVLLALAIPAITVLWERDQRGLHELASGTLVARLPGPSRA